MGCLNQRLSSFLNNRWLVFVAAMWIQSCAGIGYLFGSISPAIKTSLNYNQRQVARLGVAKDLGDSVGFLAGSLSEILPLWAALLIGVIQNFVGYGWFGLLSPAEFLFCHYGLISESFSLLSFLNWFELSICSLSVMCILIFIGTNGETYFNTAALVSCVQNFPKSRGPVVGILKGFAGLGGAILTQIYAVMHSPDHASLIFMVAVGPTMVVIALMFIVRPVGGHKQIRPSDGHPIVILLIPILIPVALSFSWEPRTSMEEALLPESQKEGPSKSEDRDEDIIFSEIEDEKPNEVDLLPASERQKRIAQLQAKLAQAAADGAVRIKKRRPHRGEDFTLMEALIKADFWLIFFSLLLGSGSGLTVIDNLGQMSQSLGYDNTHVFVSMISIWNFLGRVGGGYFSEKIVRDYAYPRPIAMAGAQVIMAVGHFFFAMGWPGAMYVGTLLVGLGYGAHWAIVPAAASELFGLKKFGALYNFLTLANPAGSLVFSGLIASSIYDREAEKQAHGRHPGQRSLLSSFSSFVFLDDPLKCDGAICFFLTSMIMSGLCIIAVVLSMILVYRTKTVYTHLYGRTRK
ncbi:hypothetical protein Sango_0074300 [Sesamum angolense]|uniref:Nodulin-like domain-containing protein n=1 Tax=Sesamum angolense TaxID=2727404 RepID=A0AAE2C5P4_9LAMI|nr:hypothetical protein Sango_0074300 [Sesamum angolense]